MRLTRALGVLLLVVASIGAPETAVAQYPIPKPVPSAGPAADRATVALVMRAVNVQLAFWSAAASVSDSAEAWQIVTPSGPYWDRAHAWLTSTLRARLPRGESESPQHFIRITSAIVRGDSLIASFQLGSTYPDRHISPATVFRVRARWGEFGWGTPTTEATLYID